MYCTKCMKSIGNANFCPDCGAKGAASIGLYYLYSPILATPLKAGFWTAVIVFATFYYNEFISHKYEGWRMLAGGLNIGILVVVVAFIRGIFRTVSRRSFKHRMQVETEESKTLYSAGDRVFISSKFAGTIKPDESGYVKEIIFDNVEPIKGTVVNGGRYMITVEWDSSEYRIFRELMQNAAGDYFAVDQGRVR